MEEADKNKLKQLQQFFKQRNKQNEAKNTTIIHQIGPLLSAIEGATLSESDKRAYQARVTALGNFLETTKKEWTVAPKLMEDQTILLEHPKGCVKIVDLGKGSNSDNDSLSIYEKVTYLILLTSKELPNTLAKSIHGKSLKQSWTYNEDSETATELYK
jgi:hypothetical protein